MNYRKIICGYCRYEIPPGQFGYRTKGVCRHLDCHTVYKNEVFSREKILSRFLKIRTAEEPRVVISGKTFRGLVRSSIENFPYQSTQFTLGSYDGKIVGIEGFCEIPMLKTVMPPRSLPEWRVDNSTSAKRRLKNILRGEKTNGYIHCHDTTEIGMSDLFYGLFISSIVPEKLHKRIAVHIQFNFFTPTMRELIFLNHKRFGGSRYLIKPDYSATENLTRYLQPETKEDSQLMERAKRKASQTILSKPSKHISAFSTTLAEVKDYESSCEEEKVLDKLADRVRGKIKELPLVIS